MNQSAKAILVCVVIFLSGFAMTEVKADTNISGNIITDTVWSNSNSPYVIAGTAMVYPGVTLTIEAGVIIKFDQSAGLKIGGQLIARGTDNDQIVFTANTSSPASGYWDKIEFAKGSIGATFDSNGNYLSGSILENCIIEYGNGVYATNTECNVFIAKSTFTSGGIIFSLYNYDFDVNNIVISIRDNEITNGSISVSAEYFKSNIDISNNYLKNGSLVVYFNYWSQSIKVMDNHIVGGILRCFEDDTDHGVYIIDGNIVESNKGYSKARVYGGGVIIDGCQNVSFTNNIIQDNEGGISGGVYFDGVNTLDIRGNVITNNTSNPGFFGISMGPPAYAGGLSIIRGENATIHDNSIFGNKGQTIKGSSGGIAVLYSHPVINGNDIFGNVPYNLYNEGSNESPIDINAQNNWWGTTDIPTIERKIYDYYDDFTLGKVIYSPIAMSPFFPTLSTNINPPGSGSITENPNKTTYNSGDQVTLTATANPGYTFSNWTGDASGSANPITITMNGPKGITANFTQNQYTLTVTIFPTGSGSFMKNPDKPTYTYGEQVQLTATANPGYTFGNWSGDAKGSSNPVTVTISGNKTMTANFTQDQYTLTVNISPPGVGVVTKVPDKTNYVYGDVVTLTGTANAGYTFNNWSVDASSSANPITITMNGNKTITSNFTQNQYTLTMNINPTGSGSVTRNPNKSTYVYGDVVELTANAATGCSFISWSGDASGTNNPVTLTIDSNKTITANFATTSVTPKAYDFGNVKVKKSKTASFVVKNSGKTNLSITSAITGTDASMFKITSGGGSKRIKPGKSLTVKVAFKPTSKGSKSGNLEITSNDPVAPTIDIPLSGTGQ